MRRNRRIVCRCVLWGPERFSKPIHIVGVALSDSRCTCKIKLFVTNWFRHDLDQYRRWTDWRCGRSERRVFRKEVGESYGRFSFFFIGDNQAR